jgi:hypothetical protein
VVPPPGHRREALGVDREHFDRTGVIALGHPYHRHGLVTGGDADRGRQRGRIGRGDPQHPGRADGVDGGVGAGLRGHVPRRAGEGDERHRDRHDQHGAAGGRPAGQLRVGQHPR